MSVAPEAIIRKILVGNTAHNTLTGGRIYIANAPQTATFPYQVLTRIDGEHYQHFTNPSGSAVWRVQLDTYHSDPLNCHAVSESARGVLDGYTGAVTVGSTTQTVKHCRLVADNTGFVSADDGGDSGIFQESQDYGIGYAL